MKNEASQGVFDKITIRLFVGIDYILIKGQTGYMKGGVVHV